MLLIQFGVLLPMNAGILMMNNVILLSTSKIQAFDDSRGIDVIVVGFVGVNKRVPNLQKHRNFTKNNEKIFQIRTNKVNICQNCF